MCEHGFTPLGQRREVDTETAVGAFGAGDALEQQINLRTGSQGCELSGELREHTALGGRTDLFDDAADGVFKRGN